MWETGFLLYFKWRASTHSALSEAFVLSQKRIIVLDHLSYSYVTFFFYYHFNLKFCSLK